LLYGIPEAVFVALVAYGILVIIGTLTTATIAFKIYRKAKPGLEKMHSLGNLNPEQIGAELEKRFPVMVHNATVEMIDSGAFDGLMDRYEGEIVKMAQTLGQNLATVTFAKLAEKTSGQQGGIQKGINAQERKIADAQFDQIMGMEGGADVVDEFAAEFGIPAALARQYAPLVINFVKAKFGHMIPQLQAAGQGQVALPPTNGPQRSGGWP
jgi:hypothetical protein